MDRKPDLRISHSDFFYQEDLKELKERFKLIVNAYGEMMTLINRDYVYVAVNDTWCTTFKKKRVDFIGVKVEEVLGEKRFNSKIKNKIDHCLQGNIFSEGDSFKVPGGGLRYYAVTYFPITNKNQEVTHVMVVNNDVTERKKAQIALKKSEKKLRELNRIKDQYLAIINSDLEQASKYVNSLLPDEISTNWLSISWKIIPSTNLGGDSFGYHWIDKENLAMYMLDVTGHGVGAALHSVSVLNVLKSENLQNTDFRAPHEVLHGLNRIFQMSGYNDLFFSMWYIAYNRRTCELTYAGAGHPPLLVFSENGTQEKLFSRNTMIGIDDQYEFHSDTYKIRDITSIYMYTDGAYEINYDGKMMSYEDLANYLSKHQNEPESEVDMFYKLLVELNNNSLDDDFTMMKISINPG